jgi:hypothetical protein
MQSTIPKLESLIRSVVPDLAGIPLYIVLASDLATREILPTDCRGLWGKSLDLTLKSHLEHRGRFIGRGVGIVIDDEKIMDDANKSESRGSLEYLVDYGITKVGFHEVAHALEDDFDMSDPTCERVEAATDMSINAASAWSYLPSDIPGWYAHELPWIRNVIHLRHRLAVSGNRIGMPYLFAADCGMSDCWAYASALGDEPRQLANASFAAIRKIRPPQAFIDRWRSDVRSSLQLRADWSPRWVDIHVGELQKYAA